MSQPVRKDRRQLADGTQTDEPRSDLADRLREEISGLEVVDAHCHPVSHRDAKTTVAGFLERISLSGFAGDGRPDPHIQNTGFVRGLTKELARFLGCRPVLAEVIEARNERGQDYARYLSDLFRDAGITEVLIDTGYTDGLDETGVKATFLTCGGIAERYPEAVKAIAQRGHEIAGHGYHHEKAW